MTTPRNAALAHVPRPSAPGRRAFSLIEVLIAVVVLSLGLLGLGMVFPVVVRQQRQAQDTIQGLSSVRSAASYILGRNDLFTDPTNPTGTKTNKLWEYSEVQANTEKGVEVDFHRWQAPSIDPAKVFTVEPLTGMLYVPDPAAPTDKNKAARIPVAERLFPKPFSSSGAPQFVWDFAVRKSGATTYELALFARRIDPGIRIPVNTSQLRYVTLSNVLTGAGLATTVEKAAFRVPVAVDSKGRPTLSGAAEDGRTPNYSAPRLIEPNLKVIGALPANVLVLSNFDRDKKKADDTLLVVARQPGQKFIDNRGTVHTVLRVVTENDTSLPGFRDRAQDSVVLERDLSPDLLRDIGRVPGFTASTAHPVNFVFTPQVPAAVTVVTLQK